MRIKFKLISMAVMLVIAFVNITATKANTTQALLVLDTKNIVELPKHFRTTLDLPSHKNKINWTGFSDLHMAGGSQFSESALRAILQHLDTHHLTIIDLRQESHGFLNGAAVSWYGPQNAENADKSARQIEKDQVKHLKSLDVSSDAVVYDILKKADDGTIAQTTPLTFHVKDTESEAQLAKQFHVNYNHFYVQDFHAPDAKEVDRFIRIMKKLPRDQWIYFHCRAGVGRTSTFMTMLDMMRNAKSVSFDDILARQTAIGGKDLTDMPSPTSFKYQYAVERLEFLKKFYVYARDNQDDFETLWSQWSVNIH